MIFHHILCDEKHIISKMDKIIKEFQIEAKTALYGEGHINDTYLLQVIPHEYIIQRINHNVFKDPESLMENIAAVTEHVRKKIIARGENPDRKTLTVIKTRKGSNFHKTDDGMFYRMYKFITDSVTYQTVQKPEQFYNAAKAFGRFQNDLSDFPANELTETIPNFHNTRMRFTQLLQAIDEDRAGRKKDVAMEIEFALEREKDTDIIVNALSSKKIPLRVTHNDTKLNNVLFDEATDEAVCVIDLDTVMPGSLLYDFGDSIRFGTNPAPEDEVDLSKVFCDLNLFEAFTKGFLEELSGSITESEINLLAFSAKLMTYECGIRFLADYLNGDIYFKTHRPAHNLDRARTQLKLVKDMEEKMDKMEEIVKRQ